MAQFYQLLGQAEQPIQAVTIEELRQYYPNLTCVDASAGVQYITNQEDGNAQFQPQQVVLTSDQHIVLNSTEMPQVIVDQSQLQFNQGYMKQEGEIIEYNNQQPETSQTTQPQVFYATTGDVKQQQIIQPQNVIVNHKIADQRVIGGQIVTNPRIVTQQIVADRVQHMVNQPVAVVKPHLIQQRRVYVEQSPQQGTPVRPQQAPQPEATAFQQVAEQNNAENQLVRTDDGRFITLAQFIKEKQENNTPVRRRVSPPKPRVNALRGRGGRGGGRGGQNNRSPLMDTSPPQLAAISKPAQQANNITPQPNKTMVQYQNNKLLMQSSGPTGQHLTQQQIARQLTQNRLQQQRIINSQSVRMPQLVPTQRAQVISQQQGTIQVQSQVPAQLQTQIQGQVQTLVQGQVQTTVQGQVQIQAQTPIQTQVQTPIQTQVQAPLQTQVQSQVQVQPQSPISGQVQGPRTPGPQPQHFQQQFQAQAARQQPIPLIPPFNGIQKRAFSPSNQNHQILDDSSSSINDEYKDFVKMLVCSENGEQRLITFTLPKDNCTVQDLLEQVGVPFNADTRIVCRTNTGMRDINYVVTVGAVSQPVNTFIETQQAISENSQPANVPQPPLPKEPPKSPEKPQEPVKEKPRLVPGYLAVCSHCGYLSEDFNRCQRCKTKLPDEPKSMACPTTAKPLEVKKEISPARVAPKPNNIKLPINKPGRKTKKVAEIEPVILTLSSDDEDTPVRSNQNASSPLANRTADGVCISALQKEPIYPDDLQENFEEDESLLNIGQEITSENAIIANLPCRTIRIGTYKFVPREDVVITNIGLKIMTPLISDPTKEISIFIPSNYILKVLVNFHKTLPVLFFYVMPSAGTLVRKKLCMEQGSDIYFDPLSKEDSFKRITLLPDSIAEETKAAIMDVYSMKFNNYPRLEELSTKEANEILIRTCPREPKRDSFMNSNEPKQLLIYPPPPAKGGITINVEDYLCLAQDQFLNDAIIDFYLKYLQTEVLPPGQQDRVHIFSSFFYKRLTTKPVKASKRLNPFEIDPSLTPAQKRHCRVKKWTKNVNIFEKDYVIIPINENSHWFLAIICFPGLEGCRAYNDCNRVVKLAPKEKKKSIRKSDITTCVVIGNTTITLESKKGIAGGSGGAGPVPGLDKAIKCDDEELSDRDEAEGDESELDDSETDSEVEEKKAKTREPIKQPCILIFDSLAGAGRSRVVATLRDYLTCEHRTKLNSTKTFSKDNIKGACPKVPQQMNFTDCGLYVLQYVEAFFTKPIMDYHIPIKELKNWFEEIVVTRKREEISYLIRDLMTEMKRDVSNIPDITFPTLNGKLITGNIGEEPMSEEEEEFADAELEPGEIPPSEYPSSSLVSEMYNSDDNSEDSKQLESSPKESTLNTSSSQSSLHSSGSSVLTLQTNSGTVLVTDINTVYKADSSELQKKSNRETMSYLKSKRILRHKNNDFENNKKQKTE